VEAAVTEMLIAAGIVAGAVALWWGLSAWALRPPFKSKTAMGYRPMGFAAKGKPWVPIKEAEDD
jgi:hypothetical protein